MAKARYQLICAVVIISKVLYNVNFDRSLAKVGVSPGW